jgi:putative peptidoglycan lipid II flippase
VLYLLPISLFGISVAAAELPELSRLGPAGRPAIADRLFLGMERVTFYVAFTMSMYIFAGDVIVGGLLQRGQFDAADTQVVWYTLAAFSLGLLGTTRSRVLQNGLFALNRTKLVARIAVLRVAIAAMIGGALMFPFDRLAIVDGSVERLGNFALQPLPATVRLAVEDSPRLGVVGLALGAAASSWIEYRLLRGALDWRLGGALPGPGHDSRWSIIAGLGVGVLAAGIRANTQDLALPLAAILVVGVAGAVYLGITATMGVGEARALIGRLRRLLPG